MLELNQVYQGDCLEVMQDIDDNSIDLIIIDPPYLTTKKNGIKKRMLIMNCQKNCLE